MFEFLFKYPASVFNKGSFVFLGSWPLWTLFLLLLGVAAVFGWSIYRLRAQLGAGMRGVRPAAVWLLQTLLAGLLLLLLWQPALSIATLKPQQNIVAVVVDDSRSMALQESGSRRIDQAKLALDGGLLDSLKKQFQVRIYRLGQDLERIDKVEGLNATAPSTRIGQNLRQVVAEAGSLPIGAVVLLSDGSDNSGGIDLETISQIRQKRIPVHTVGIGKEQFDRDLEISDARLPSRALANSRLSAEVSFRERGYAGSHAKLTVRSEGKTLASQDITIKKDGQQQTETILFNSGAAGGKTLEIGIEPLEGEQNRSNNQVTRLVQVETRKPRILYIEGEPRWEFKFIRRAAEEDRSLDLVSMLRTTQNKIYRQGLDPGNPKELEDGFPTKVEDLFAYQGLIIGGIEAGYFTPAQQDLIKQFADRRGGGILFLGGRAGLTEGGLAKSALADILPVTLPDSKTTFFREPATAELTQAGRDSLLCRIEENPDRNVERWKKLPYLANYQIVGPPKPGAVVLAELLPTSKGRHPLLITENYGKGRVALFATAGSWRWQMLQDVSDKSHEMFWQQLLRWTVQETPGRLIASTPRPVLVDESHVKLRAEVKDKTYLWSNDARVHARILGPDGVADQVELNLEPASEGVYTADWNAPKPGSYLAEITADRNGEEIGRDVVLLRREDGVAENFRLEQNRELLEKLASQTGGKYYRPDEVKRLGEEIAYSDAGLTVRETKDLWDMPVVFLAALLLRGSEWLLRRKWGVV